MSEYYSSMLGGHKILKMRDGNPQMVSRSSRKGEDQLLQIMPSSRMWSNTDVRFTGARVPGNEYERKQVDWWS